MKAVIFAENGSAALELASAAQKLGATELVQVAFGPIDSAAAKLATVTVPAGQAVENSVESIKAWFAGQGADIVVAEPTRRLKVIVGRLAASCGASALANIVSLDGEEFSSMYYGGVANKKVKVTSAAKFVFVGAGVCEPAAAAAPAAEEIAWVAPAAAIEVVSSEALEKSSVDLGKSAVVVACGRGFAEKADLDPAYALAEKIGAGVGCSRPLAEAVDWFPREAYIGVSGQMIKPKAYIGIGISGQMQHMIGVNGAGTIFAINKDKDAPIFKNCDYGIIGDIKAILPALNDAL